MMDPTNAVLELVVDRLRDVLVELGELELEGADVEPVRIGLLEAVAMVAELALDRRDAACYVALGAGTVPA